jgi:hypothetical protein
MTYQLRKTGSGEEVKVIELFSGGKTNIHCNLCATSYNERSEK